MEFKKYQKAFLQAWIGWGVFAGGSVFFQGGWSAIKVFLFFWLVSGGDLFVLFKFFYWVFKYLEKKDGESFFFSMLWGLGKFTFLGFLVMGILLCIKNHGFAVVFGISSLLVVPLLLGAKMVFMKNFS